MLNTFFVHLLVEGADQSQQGREDHGPGARRHYKAAVSHPGKACISPGGFEFLKRYYRQEAGCGYLTRMLGSLFQASPWIAGLQYPPSVVSKSSLLDSRGGCHKPKGAYFGV